ncbi:transmembrane amino acid transporter protein-domain-containing protein [Dichotomocladium elegans]|nr:transmembrane amino acid transporter protein-domain-containing protein [Dichotomocladium elegans]
MSTPIRVPTNTHPSRLPPNYGTLEAGGGGGAAGEASSLRSAVESFTGSYSRASLIYLAENLTVTSHHDSVHGSEQQQDTLEDDTASKYSQYLVGRTYSFPSLSRHTTVASVLAETIPQDLFARSTFLQSVFNAVNVLIGIGILALPLAFRCGGWLGGGLIFLFCAVGTNYTAKIIARCLDAAPGASTYGDMGAAAYNDSGRAFVSSVFIVELMTIGIAMVVLLGDGIQSFWPELDLMTVRVVSFFILTPTLFLPMRKLAITSLVGIIACVCLLITVLVDGLSKKSQPGSLLEPMETEWLPSDMTNLPLAFGLVMAGFSGHAVFPSIYRDMQDPKQYERMVDIAYVVTSAAYIAMAIMGYLMFGPETMQEITQNLASTAGYSKIVTRIGVSLIILTPLAKYGLMLNPVNLTWELWLLNKPSVEAWCKFHTWRKHFVTGTIRVITSLLIIIVATLFPGFDRVVSLLGALFSFGISAIFPLLCYRRLFAGSISLWESVLNNSILVISTIMAILGTIWTFLPNNL